MDQEFSMNEQDFTTIKEKIIKTHELLQLYNEKDEKLGKATQAFKQLKAKYESSVHETNRLKFDNERLNYSLEAIRQKYEQCEKDLFEVRSDLARVDEKYQQTVIESQLTITDMEEKIRHCTCEKNICLSPSKRHRPTEKIKELKAICKELKDVENNLRKENDTLLIRNKQLKDDNLKVVKTKEELAVQNANLQKELTLVKNNVQNLELLSQDQKSLQESVSSIKEKHDREIHCLKMEISKLSLENRRIKYLELECKHLKEQQNNKTAIKVDMFDFGDQTDDSSVQHSTHPEIFLNKEKIKSLEVVCKELKNSKQSIGVTETYVQDCRNSDSEDVINDIFKEMICPMALSPFSISPSASPIPPNEPLQLLDDNPEPILVPNIIVTPPTPNIDKDNYVNKSFTLPAANLEEHKPQTDVIVEEQNIAITETMSCERQPVNFKSLDSIDNTLVTNAVINNIGIPITSCVTQNMTGTKNLVTLTETGPSKYIKEYSKKKVSNKNADMALLEKSKNSKEIEVTSKSNNNTIIYDQISEHTSNHVSPKELVPFCKKSVSTETDLRLANTDWITSKQSTKMVDLRRTSSWTRVQRKRKFWIPYNLNTFVKVGRRKEKLSKVSKQYDTPNTTLPTDTILNALTTLKKHNINFTISNESIPLIQPYSCCSLIPSPKIEPKNTARKFKDTFTDSLISCWDKHCTDNNSRMLLKKVQNQDEPDLLGFFSIKDEIVTPSVSRLDVPANPKPLNEQDVVTQILNRINELVNVSRNNSTGNKRKKRSKMKNRRSDFYSETETELENLFNKSAVLERNRKFLATAKEQSVMSNGESVFDSESDVMVDSGLVTATPKTDGETLDSCGEYNINQSVNLNSLSPIANYSNNLETNLVSQNYTNDLSEQNKNCAGFALPPPPVLINNFKPTSSFQASSSPLQTYGTNASSNNSPDNFKVPFCPIMISPMASLKDSPINHPLKMPNVSDTIEDSLESFKMPFCPVMISPLTPSIKRSSNEPNPTIKNMEVNSFSALEGFKTSSNPENNTNSTIDRFGTNSIYNGKLKSSLCQKLTFDSVTDNNTLSNTFENKMEIENTLCNISSSQPLKNAKDNKELSNRSSELGKNEIREAQNNTFDALESCSTKLLYVDLSIHSEDLNCTLNDINISQLDSSFDQSQNKVITNGNPDKINKLKSSRRGKSNKDIPSKVESRYSLRRKSQCKAKKEESKEDTNNIISPKEITMNCMGPRTRALKRKMEEEQKYGSSIPKSNNLDVPLGKKRSNKKNIEEPSLISEGNNQSSLITFDREISNATTNCNLVTSNVILNIDKSVSIPSNENKHAELLSNAQKEVYLTNNLDTESINLNAGFSKNVDSEKKANTAQIDSQQITIQEPDKKITNDDSKHEAVPKYQQLSNATTKCNLATSNVILNIDKSVSIPSNENKHTELLNNGQKEVYLTNNLDTETINLNAGFGINVDSVKKANSAQIDSQQIIIQEPDKKITNDGNKHEAVPKLQQISNATTKCNLVTSNVILNIDKSVSISSNENKHAELLNNAQKEVYLTNNLDTEAINLNAGCSKNVDSEKKENTAQLSSQQVIIQEPDKKIKNDGSKHEAVAKHHCKKDQYKLNNKNSNSNKFVSKEFITDSESENDISFKSDGKAMLQKSNNRNNTLNVINNEIKEKNLDTISDSVASKSISKTQEVTGEIQTILRNIPEVGTSFPKKCSQDHGNNTNKYSQLFGDLTDSEEESSFSKCKKKGSPLKELVKKKAIQKKEGLKKKIRNQVKDPTIIDTILEATGSISRTTNSSSIDKDKKINVVQDILISKGHIINLLPEANHSEKVSIAEKLPPKVSKQTSLITHPRIKSTLEQNNSNGSSVDILSEVMKEMVRTGPRTWAKKSTTKQVNRSFQSKLQTCNSVKIPVGMPRDTVVKPSETATKPMTDNKDVEFMECPKSPEVMEVPDRLPKLIPAEKPRKFPPSKVRVLMDKLMVFSNETEMVNEVIREFAFQEKQYMAEIILDKVSRDYHDKADMLFPSSPPMTSTQRILLGFLLKLEKSTHSGIMDTFLSLAELLLFNSNRCTIRVVEPITRLYTAVCKVRCDLHRIRRYMCDGFYFMGDFAIPMFFTLLTMWPEVLPMASETLGSSGNLLAKVIVQIIFLKDCNKPGYNLLPLRDMLHKFFGYATERWDCNDIFKEIMVEYIRNPSIRLSDFTLLLFLKNKPIKWAYEKVKQNIIPLYEQVADSNLNLKATLLILLANICCSFQRSEEDHWAVIQEMEKWFRELDEDNSDPIIKRSIHLARGRIPRKPVIKKNKKQTTQTVKESGNMLEGKCQKEQNCVKEIPGLEDSRQSCSNSDNSSVKIKTIMEAPNITSTNNSVNINSTSDHIEKNICKNNDSSNSVDSDFSDIEF